jgi:hypothetical protein
VLANKENDRACRSKCMVVGLADKKEIDRACRYGYI